MAILEKIPLRITESNKNKVNFGRKIQFLEEEVNKLRKEQETIERKATEIYGRISGHELKINECKRYDK